MSRPSSSSSATPGVAVLDGSDASLVAAALAEDLGPAGTDVTTRLVLEGGAGPRALARITAKAPGRLSGIGLSTAVFQHVDPTTSLDVRRSDGDAVRPGDTVFEVHGAASSLLIAERTALNILGRLSGVATLTALFVEAVAGTTASIVDTRKTTPGWRRLEKEAVRHGGGVNHRMGLHDEVLLKENHFAMASDADYGAVVRRVRAQAPVGMRLTAEACSLAEARAAADAGADVILLDNMTPAGLAEVVQALAGHPRRADFALEASGGVDLTTVASVAAAGVDRISIGALTHSAPTLDLSQLLHLEGAA